MSILFSCTDATLSQFVEETFERNGTCPKVVNDDAFTMYSRRSSVSLFTNELRQLDFESKLDIIIYRVLYPASISISTVYYYFLGDISSKFYALEIIELD